MVLRSIGRAFTTLRKLQFLTVPDTQFCDVLARPMDLPGVARTIAEKLYEMRNDWDVLELSYMSRLSQTPGLLANEMSKMGLRINIQSAGQNPFIHLEGGWDTFYSQRSRRLKKGNNLIANHLNRSGNAVIAQLTDNTDLETIVRTVTEVSSRSWKNTTGLSLDNASPQLFIARLSRHAAENGWLSVWLLTLDEKPVAMEYQLIYQGRVHALRSDFDESYGELSPGTYLNWKLLEQLFNHGLRTYYMGSGDNAYKLRWTESSEPLCRVRAYSSTATARLLYWIDEKLRPAAVWVRDFSTRLFHGIGRNKVKPR